MRVQFPSWKEENFEPDEDGTLPGWAENNWGEVQQKATKLLQLVRPIREKYIDIYKELLSMRDNSITKGMTRHIRDKLFEQSCNVFNKRVEEASKDMINECRLIEGYVPD